MNVAELVGLHNGDVRVPAYDWVTYLQQYFKKLPKIKSSTISGLTTITQELYFANSIGIQRKGRLIFCETEISFHNQTSFQSS